MLENKTVEATYEAPKVEMYEVLVEQGFSASLEPIGDTNPELDW